MATAGTTTRAEDRGRRRRLPVVLVAAAATLILLLDVAYAVFSDQEVVDQNASDTATIALSTSPTSQLFALTDVLPGFGQTFTLDVSNGGSAELRYAMSTSVVSDSDSTNPLSSQLSVDVYAGATTDDCATIVSNTTAIFSGSLADAGFGSSAQGADTGDRVLAAGSAERLCLDLTLALSTGNEYQNDSTEVSFTFDAEQTANNP